MHVNESAAAKSAIMSKAENHYCLVLYFTVIVFCPLLSQDDDKTFRRAPSWRKKFRPKDVRGLAAGSAETLPANFRVTSSLSSPSVPPKKMQLDGTWVLVAGAWVVMELSLLNVARQFSTVACPSLNVFELIQHPFMKV